MCRYLEGNAITAVPAGYFDDNPVLAKLYVGLLLYIYIYRHATIYISPVPYVQGPV